ncbi:hypothetical protein A2U01_0104965 [Trifolium medium]|uniref:Uncharacterized protein n=1 Tax=Trifolium medium TaxID=97028 RepID=A0A392V8T9_9FABA|nr:hypothetical protein [Trifolium medium]
MTACTVMMQRTAGTTLYREVNSRFHACDDQ